MYYSSKGGTERRHKKGAHTYHVECWNFLTIGRKLKELKIVNDGNPLLIKTIFCPLCADDLQDNVSYILIFLLFNILGFL